MSPNTHISALATELLQSTAPLVISGILIGISATLLSQLIHNDWKDFIALGPGGTPQTIPGYLKLKMLSIFAIRDPYKPAPIPADLSRRAYLSKVPKRSGPRPEVRGLAPHRQMDQRETGAAHARFRAHLEWLAAAHPRALRSATSCLEKHGLGLFARAPLNLTGHCPAEICHAHASDGSMHLALHPADAQLVIRQGWGQRHPLGRGGWMSWFVPAGFMMVYAPRNDAELEVVKQIVAAACWWIGGVDVNGEVGSVVPPPTEKTADCLDGPTLALKA